MELNRSGERDLESSGPECLQMRDKELAPYFAVHGRFYEINGKDAPYLCRDVLEITRVANADTELCDAIFVMMNPGGSKPHQPVTPSTLDAASMVLAKPDKTQYQLMRLMEAFQWSYVRVLNLSDLREPKSMKLPVLLNRFQEDKSHDGHSVFSSSRKAELPHLLTRKPAALVFAAWGVSRKLKELADLALTAMHAQGATKILGLPHQSSRNGAYYHPLPRKAAQQKKWCEDAFALIDAQHIAALDL